MSILHIIEEPYRATLEEQDDPALWLSASLRGLGAKVDILLRGAAVAYAVRGQDAHGLVFGERRQTKPPRIEDDLARLAAKGARLAAVEEDVTARGIRPEELVADVKLVARAALPALLRSYDQVLSW
jgi:predicted peroxiredoxin